MPEAPPKDDAARPTKELTAVLGKIIDQLSLSAWMPGMGFVGGAALLASIRRQDSSRGELNFISAIEDLTKLSIGAAVLLVGAVLLATLLTQAFEFEMIRFLEGYWPDGRIFGALTRWGVRRQALEKRKVHDRIRQLEAAAFKSACKRMVKGDHREVVREVRALWKADRKQVAYPLVTAEAAYLYQTWRESAFAEQLRVLEASERAAKWYPLDHRLLPTRLGNTLRSMEDKMKLADGGDLQGFVLRNYERISPQLLSQLTSFRTRLDMYCSLVLVSLILALMSVPALWPFYAWGRLALLVALLFCSFLAVAAYRAAVASARGYGSALRASDAEVEKQLRVKGGDPGAN